MDNYDDFRKKIGIKLTQLIEERKLTREAVALEIGVDKSFIGRIEKAQRKPSLETIFKLAGFFGMSISEFLDIP
jgi:putative transcriptional regulator